MSSEKERLVTQLLDLKPQIMDAARMLKDITGTANKQWWQDPRTGSLIQRNVGEMLMLVTSELSEAAEGSPQYNIVLMEVVKILSKALEGHRKGLTDDKLTEYPMFDVEIVDAVIRLLDIAFHLVPSFEAIFFKKTIFNLQREDHKPENRLKEGGKKY